MTALIIATTITAIVEAKRANAIYTKRRTAVHKDIYQRNRNTLKRYTKRNLIQTKITIAILRTNISNTLSFIKEIMRININKAFKAFILNIITSNNFKD